MLRSKEIVIEFISKMFAPGADGWI
jgi:hypothetical protein